MVREITYEEQTLNRINEFRTRQKEAQTTAEKALKEAKYFGDYADELEKVMSFEKQRGEFSQIQSSQLSKSSTWQTLKGMMTSNGTISAIDAVSFLVQMKVFTDREEARHAIYSTIHNHKNELFRIGAGVYRLKGSNEISTKTVHLHEKHPRENKMKGMMSFPIGLKKVLQDAHGVALNNDLIWERMQTLGVISTAKNPSTWIDIHAKRLGAEKVLPHTWRWKDNQNDAWKLEEPEITSEIIVAHNATNDKLF